MYRRTFARVDLACQENVRERERERAVKRMLGSECKLLAVVKADAYGHGQTHIARAAEQAGADWLGVALAEEGEILRGAGVQLPILILGPVNEAGMRVAVSHQLTLTVFTKAQVDMAQQAAVACGKTAEVHIKLDTGMNRIGVKSAEELEDLLAALEKAPDVRLTGCFTHFADGGNPDTSFTDSQLQRFREMLPLLPEGCLTHAAASSALMRLDARFQMVRIGIALYGYPMGSYSEGVRPILRWEAESPTSKPWRRGRRWAMASPTGQTGLFRWPRSPRAMGMAFPAGCLTWGRCWWAASAAPSSAGCAWTSAWWT